MKIRRDYMIKYVESVPYLIPYGQSAAQKLNGVKLDDDGVFLWGLLQEGCEETDCARKLADHKQLSAPTETELQYVEDYFHFLEKE